MNRLSLIFQPLNIIPKNAQVKAQNVTSKSQRLMLDLGIIRQANAGNFHFLPLGLRSIQKLKDIIDCHMKSINAQKVACPTLVDRQLWEKSGRLKTATPELFTLKDRHDHTYILSPTHEEAITDLVTSVSPLSYKHFPLRLYQITSKFRDEMKPRFGLMRSRQFLMKDLYTFDTSLETAKDTYSLISATYDRVFISIGVEYIKVAGFSGNIGGTVSHEYHYKTPVGEDKIMLCEKCNYSGNVELSGDQKCPQCESTDITISNGIEVGHTFLLGDKYSKPMNATYLASNGKPKPVQMGCYGLGISRILAASLEKLSLEHELRWPMSLAPYKVLIITPKTGSKEEKSLTIKEDDIYQKIDNLNRCEDDVLLDDRTQLTIGKRFLEAKQVGYPFVVVLGAKATQTPPLFELNNLFDGSQYFLDENELLSYLDKNT